MRILLVEDEKRMAQAICEIFRFEKYEVDCYFDGESGLYASEGDIYDLLVLDVMLPVYSGFEIVRRIRKKGIRTPVLMLTAKSDVDDKVEGLDSGADDYLTKPFDTKELLARVRALTRRNISSPDNTLSYGDIVLDPNTFNLNCTATGQSIRLGKKEYHILEYLISNQKQILTREQLAEKVWGYECDAEYNNVEAYMSFTRKKLNFIGSKTAIKSVRGVGYELRYENV